MAIQYAIRLTLCVQTFLIKYLVQRDCYMHKVHKSFGFGLDRICWDKITLNHDLKCYIARKIMDSLFYYCTLIKYM